MGLVRCAALGISGHREKPGEDFSTALRGCRFDPRPVSRSMGLSDRMTNCSGIWATDRLSLCGRWQPSSDAWCHHPRSPTAFQWHRRLEGSSSISAFIFYAGSLVSVFFVPNYCIH